MIGGSINANIQVKTDNGYNDLGERIQTWQDVCQIEGFIDYVAGESNYSMNAKIQDTSHVFICDYKELNFNSDNARMVINGNVYDILLIDDPMELHQHLEFYLKYIGVGQNVC